MAQANKLSEEERKKFERKENVRKVDVREARKYYLIVCEGEKTEPNYFLALVSDLHPVTEVHRFDIDGTGYNTRSLVEYAVKKRTQLEKTHLRDIDSLWIVFDKDSFSPDDFNSAIAKCEAENAKRPVVKATFTNQAFELWYLLHFNKIDAGLNRNQYKKKLSEAISNASGKSFIYKKKDPNMYKVLKQYGNPKLAIKRAEKLITEMWIGRKDYSNHNPRTHVHELVKELFKLEEELQHK